MRSHTPADGSRARSGGHFRQRHGHCCNPAGHTAGEATGAGLCTCAAGTRPLLLAGWELPAGCAALAASSKLEGTHRCPCARCCFPHSLALLSGRPPTQKIDFNRELTTVAVSNMATGVAGCGFTGSYIFS